MDNGQDIEVDDIMTIEELIALQADTEGRFSFEIDASGMMATCWWVNYYKTAQGNRSKDVNGSWKLLEHKKKQVVIGTIVE